MKYKKNLFIISIMSILLLGCNNDTPDTHVICARSPQLCQDIQTRGWCHSEYNEVVQVRYQLATKEPDEPLLYRALMAWGQFGQCMEIASQSKRRFLTDQTPTKPTTLLTIIEQIKNLEKQTVNSEHPQLLYYHWLHHGHRINMFKLKTLDSKGLLNTTPFQLMMASYYHKHNKEKAAIAYYKALSFLTKEELINIDYNIFASLCTYHYQREQFQLSYIWVQVAFKFGLDAQLYPSLLEHLEQSGSDIDVLNQMAHDIYESINDLSFTH